MPKEPSRERISQAPKEEASSSKVSFLLSRISNLEGEIEGLNGKWEDSKQEREKVDE